MPSRSDSVRLLAELQRSADLPRRQALATAYQRYFLRMIGLLRRRLPSYLCQRVEPADLAQSAWASFLRDFAEGQLDLDGRDSLWPLLARIAICKYHDLVEKAHTQKRDAARESSLDARSAGQAPWEPLASEPSPYEEAAAAETAELIAARLRDERQKQILTMHLGGYLVREIADEIRLSERTVKRVLQKIRDLYAEVAGLSPTGENSGLPG
jgi:RNA polymerase sigma factor (sigma-70 family)